MLTELFKTKAIIEYKDSKKITQQKEVQINELIPLEQAGP